MTRPIVAGADGTHSGIDAVACGARLVGVALVRQASVPTVVVPRGDSV